jgi:protein-tyrosine phosphatase
LSAKILVVCTANVCRSPAMAALLESRLLGVEIDSRGVRAQTGRSMCDTSARWLAGRGIKGTSHLSRPLTVADIRSSTLVLTATRWHRASVLEMRPTASVRTHTLAEAARVMEWRASQGVWPPRSVSIGERVLWLAEQLDTYRELAPKPTMVDGDDLPDPHHGAKHPRVLESVAVVADRICASLLC